jgi:hypothetical protein
MDAVWMPFREVIALIYPWPMEGDESRGARRARWMMHVALWAGLLVMLWLINTWGGLDRVLRSPWPNLHRVWLPLLGIALYPVGWLGLGLWRALREEPGVGAWPQIDTAWRETTSALEQAGINARTTPIFLMLGTMSPEVRTLLSAQGATPLALRGSAPFQVFAQRDAIIIAWGSAMSADQGEQTPLHCLCDLLMRERAPRHPLQGVIAVLPFDAQARAAEVKACREELRVVREATRLEMPIYVVVRGVPAAPAALDALLQRFPPSPDLDPAEFASMYRLGLDWLCLEEMMRGLRAHLRCEVDALADNIRLYQHASAMAKWRTRFGKVLVAATQTDDAEPGMVAGCYLLTAADQIAPALQADLLRHQGAACWTAAALARDAAQQRRVGIGYGLGAGAMACVIVGLVCLLLLR